ncbi:MAG: PUA domain-containing protein [Infirmifilum sp.]|jgi:16S rRNA (cytosine967-C5)-methyltransferase|uniref:PUA domain-containing protein n=1 Tax=Infirmifilum TaxID=2856573 RepID=UPI002356B176
MKTSTGLFRESMRSYLGKFYSREYVRELEESLRTPGSRYFMRVNTLKADPSEVAYILREEGYEVYNHPQVREAIYTHVKGPFDVNIHRGRVIVDWKTAESVYVGANVYAPGVHKVVNADKGDYVTVTSPDGTVVAEGVLEMSPPEIFRERRGLAVRTTNSVFRIVSLREHPFFREGVIYHQSLPSIVAVKSLAPKPGWTVLDMCASPGGKATHAATLMEDSGEVIAVDRSENKVRAIEENARRLGLRSVRPLLYDSRYISEVLGVNSVDAVILDPPCTTLGIRPKLIYTREEKDVYQLAEYQRQFLSEAWRVLRRGGLLLYTTCTLTPHENEFNVLYAASKLGFKTLRVNTPLKLRTPYLGIEGAVFDPVVNDTPGFFISVLRKNGESG